jgi:transposase
MIKVLYPNCAGLDVHKKFVVACRVSMDAGGNTQKQMRKFSTMRADLEEMAKWLQESGSTHVAMESSGVYWKPIYNILEGLFEVVLVNAQAIKRMPGRKTDMKDAEWIATLMQHGLLQGSFIPERQQRELRDLTRYHQSLVQERSRFANRLQKLLEDTNLKLGSVATDLQGVSAQAILRAIAQGETDPKTLAEMTHGSLRSKRNEMEQALVGTVSNHHRFMLQQLLTQLDFLNQQITQIDARIEEQLANMPAPFEKAVQLLDTIPGVNRPLAIVIVAEIGIDMSRFPSDRHITAWAGVAPGNNETGGKQRSGKTRHGNEHLETALVLAAHAAARTKQTYLRSLYNRLASRRGKQRAAVAVGRTILQAAYFMLKNGETFVELGQDYLDKLDRERTAKRLVRRVKKLGFEVNLIEQDTAHTSDEYLRALPNQLLLPTTG